MRYGDIPLARGRSLAMDGRFHVMGIINCTPDSFYPGSRAGSLEAALAAADAMIRAGATVLDVGGESTRPGSDYVSADEEIARIAPAIRAIRGMPGGGSEIAISVDTRKAAVAAAALDAGADIVNDVSALQDDPGLAALVARRGVPVVLMHKKGIPATMQDGPYYVDCVREVRDFLLDAARRAEAAGIRRDGIVIDPGIGFGKRLEDNLALLSRLGELVDTGYPVLVGLSRKSFVGAITGRPVEGRLPGTLAATCAARASGAVFFRVHDVAETYDALSVWDACRYPRRAGDSP